MGKEVGKIAIKTIDQQQPQTTKTDKQGPSKFDKRKAELDGQRSTLPPEVNQVTAEQRRVLETNLRKRMGQTTNAQDILKVDLRELRGRIDVVSEKVATVPKAPAFDAVRNRLANIEAQFQQANKVLQGLGTATSPQEMLQLQLQMHRMTQNIELLGKFIELSTGGVKTILQTQV